ncbi:hypothetical protein L208DRAFT_1416935 [Tricholoma matsutake]|nr:hypothetical protein L208DRAFT_1416935 [Tricholoma matsutake 945]
MAQRAIRVVNNTSGIINVIVSFYPIPVNGMRTYLREGPRTVIVVRANPVPVRVVPEVLTANPGVAGLIPDEGPFLVIN